MRILFKHTAEDQKEYENIHGTNIRNTAQINQLNNKASWYSGDDNPKTAIGKNGDFYRKTDGTIFQKKNGVWL